MSLLCITGAAHGTWSSVTTTAARALEGAVPLTMGMINIDSLQDNQIPTFWFCFPAIHCFVMEFHIVLKRK